MNALAHPSVAAASAALARANAQRASARYQQGQTLTVSGGQLVVLLYDGALKFLRRALVGIASHDIEAAHNGICRAQDILAELDATLDDSAGAISLHLHRIYEYGVRRLIEANVAKDAAPIHEVIALLEPLLEAWRAAVAAVETTGSAGNAGIAQVRVS